MPPTPQNSNNPNQHPSASRLERFMTGFRKIFGHVVGATEGVPDNVPRNHDEPTLLEAEQPFAYYTRGSMLDDLDAKELKGMYGVADFENAIDEARKIRSHLYSSEPPQHYQPPEQPR